MPEEWKHETSSSNKHQMKVFGFHSVSNEVEKASDMLSTWFSLRQIQLGNDKDNDAEN